MIEFTLLASAAICIGIVNGLGINCRGNANCIAARAPGGLHLTD
jgi:hypothetical protein